MLQDAHGLNVTLVLWCLWTAQGFAEPDAATLKRAIEIAGQWEDAVVAPLRLVRRRLKAKSDGAGFDSASADALRDDVKALELRAEREAQRMLEALAHKQLAPIGDGNGACHSRARRTLAAYARAAGAAHSPGFSIALLEEVIGLTIDAPDEFPDAHRGGDVNG